MNGSVVVELGMRTSQGAPYASAECVSSLTALTMHLPTTVALANAAYAPRRRQSREPQTRCFSLACDMQSHAWTA